MRALTRFITTTATVAALGATWTPTALAEGKATLGCSPPFARATVAYIEEISQPLITAGYFTQDSLHALLTSLDHNGNSSLCYAVPPGWDGPPATNGAHRQGYVNLVDDKIV